MGNGQMRREREREVSREVVDCNLGWVWFKSDRETRDERKRGKKNKKQQASKRQRATKRRNEQRERRRKEVIR